MRYLRLLLQLLYKTVREVYIKMIVQPRQEVNFWVLYAFIVMFIISRAFVYLFPWIYIEINGVHVHHFAYGFILLSILGLGALNNWHEKQPRLMGVLYGAALAVAFDEFGMWINLEDDYWIRHSYDAIMVIVAGLVSIVYFGSFWSKLFNRMLTVFNHLRRRT